MPNFNKAIIINISLDISGYIYYYLLYNFNSFIFQYIIVLLKYITIINYYLYYTDQNKRPDIQYTYNNIINIINASFMEYISILICPYTSTNYINIFHEYLYFIPLSFIYDSGST